MTSVKSGILVVDKPEGPTSHDVVARVRRILGTREVGHAGTLDPMATGVLVLAVGEATKLVPWLSASDKEYVTRVHLGVTTDTLDARGLETMRAPLPEPVLAALDALGAKGQVSDLLGAALDHERARTSQVPPAFSAVHVDGERAHVLARRGERVEIAPREVAVRSLVLLGGAAFPMPYLDLRVEVSKGYFVRSLARDLAERLGTVGHLLSLRRTRSGSFSLAEAVALGDRGQDLSRLPPAVVPLPAAAARVLPVCRLTLAGVTAARHGQRVRLDDIDPPRAEPSAWLDSDGTLVAIGEATEGQDGRVLRGFRG